MRELSTPGVGKTLVLVKMRGRQRGIALMLVLWVITLLTIIAVGLTATQRTEINLAANQVASASFRAQAEAAIQFTALNLLIQPPGATDEEAFDTHVWLPDSQPRVWVFGEQVFEIRIINEASLIDLNTANRDLLLALLTAVGPLDRDPESLVDAILDWRDEDDLHLVNGAEDPDYKAAGLPYGAKDGPFDSLEELQQVFGFNRELYRILRPALTVSSGQASPDPNFAPPLVQAALQGMSLEEMQDRLETEAGVLGENPTPKGRGGPLYRIQVRWQAPGGTFRAMETLVRIQQGASPPVEILWRSYALAPEQAPGSASGAEEASGS
ncbi:MAG: type II secretion system protein GspK [Chromatiaceae bacterium]